MHLYNKMAKFHKMHHHSRHHAHHRGPPRFTEAEDETLIAAVREFPALYDPNHQDHKNGKVKTDLWDNIALSLCRDVETCKRRWKDIKDNYYKLKRKQKLGSCKWALASKLEFLDSIVSEKRMGRYETDLLQPSPETSPSTGINNGKRNVEEIVEDNHCFLRVRGSSHVRAHSSSRERGTSHVRAHSSSRVHEQSNHQHDDDVDLFMQSIALQVKKMSPQLIARAKLSILSTVHDLQFDNTYDAETLALNDVELIPDSAVDKEMS